jgi:type I restriction enzyme M protein
MFFKATKDKKRKKNILFIDASKRFTKGKAQNSLSEQDVEDIFTTYSSNGESEKDGIAARLVSHDEIKENYFDLNFGRYLKADAAEVIDVGQALTEFSIAREELSKAEAELLKKLKAAGYA